MIVIDANVWVSYLMPTDVNHLASQQWLDQHIANNNPSIVPNLVLVEVAGAIARRSGLPAEGQRADNWLSNLPAILIIEINQNLGRLAANLAATLLLRGADAVYVAVAQQLGVPLLTWYRELLTRANSIIQLQTP